MIILLRKNLYLLLLFFLIISCGRINEIEIQDIKNLKFGGFREKNANLNVEILINNPSSYKIKIKEFEIKIIADNRYIGKLLLAENFQILPKSREWYTVTLDVKIMDILSIANIYNKYLEGEDINLHLQGFIIAKTSFFSKKNSIDKEYVLNINKRLKAF